MVQSLYGIKSKNNNYLYNWYNCNGIQKKNIQTHFHCPCPFTLCEAMCLHMHTSHRKNTKQAKYTSGNNLHTHDPTFGEADSHSDHQQQAMHLR